MNTIPAFPMTHMAIEALTVETIDLDTLGYYMAHVRRASVEAFSRLMDKGVLGPNCSWFEGYEVAELIQYMTEDESDLTEREALFLHKAYPIFVKLNNLEPDHFEHPLAEMFVRSIANEIKEALREKRQAKMQ